MRRAPLAVFYAAVLATLVSPAAFAAEGFIKDEVCLGGELFVPGLAAERLEPRVLLRRQLEKIQYAVRTFEPSAKAGCLMVEYGAPGQKTSLFAKFETEIVEEKGASCGAAARAVVRPDILGQSLIVAVVGAAKNGQCSLSAYYVRPPFVEPSVKSGPGKF